MELKQFKLRIKDINIIIERYRAIKELKISLHERDDIAFITNKNQLKSLHLLDIKLLNANCHQLNSFETFLNSFPNLKIFYLTCSDLYQHLFHQLGHKQILYLNVKRCEASNEYEISFDRGIDTSVEDVNIFNIGNKLKSYRHALHYKSPKILPSSDIFKNLLMRLSSKGNNLEEFHVNGLKYQNGIVCIDFNLKPLIGRAQSVINLTNEWNCIVHSFDNIKRLNNKLFIKIWGISYKELIQLDYGKIQWNLMDYLLFHQSAYGNFEYYASIQYENNTIIFRGFIP